MALVRKCDKCPTIEGVQKYTIRWDSGAGTTDLCEKHGAELTETVTRSVAHKGARRGPRLQNVTTIEEIEASKKKAASSSRKRSS